MKSSAQLPLELGFRPALGAADFLVAPCNQTAVAWTDRWPEWPGPGVIVHGPAGSGKSHLAQVWAARAGAHTVAASRLCDDQMDGLSPRAVVVDDADRVAGDPALEQALLHLYNGVAGDGGHLLLTARAPALQWQVKLPDLASRVRSLAGAGIEPPDDAVLAAVLVKQFADRQLTPATAVIDYLLPRMERSFAAARAMVDRLDRASLAAGRPVTIALARQALAEPAAG